MKKQFIAAAALTSLALVSGPAYAQQPAATPSTPAPAGTTSAAPQRGTATAGSAMPADHAEALRALQEARVTLARLTEASMTQDAREALARVSTDFRALYKAYTGEEPDPRKTASQADTAAKPDPNWEQMYSAVASAVDRIVGPASSAAVGTSGTSQPSGAKTGRFELTQPVQKDFEQMRQQLQRFHKAAGGHDMATKK